ncbi:sigma-54-dependent transcriptional regulator [Sulfuriroseicoccus oceanibius]|uniref:Sigma-54-dependent Fis family transcriptional regulator n=1 Tax=Sulfuriroseicoccus oceanibius TaxID=2707525 RepID=A0A6B3L2S9_9BACT|nr:sigma-54 dependent transcriptional regulator [Sulfuriroseicoccus oceanibius]QQL44510.1 sigma-54-dependent Fis family transcriptional regulator [Sulfuriroseicoccus oceanibius]
MAKILIVDGDRSVREELYQYTKDQGHDSVTAETGEAALSLLEEFQPQVMIVDFRMKDITGLELIEKAKKAYPDLAVIMATGNGSIESAVDAMRLGAFDYLTKPFQLDELGQTINSAAASTEGRGLSSVVSCSSLSVSNAKIVAESEVMRRIEKLIDRLSMRPTPLLLEGESGVGKRTLAKILHSHRHKEARPFKVLPCGALPDSLIEQELAGGRSILERAAGGTLLLDEIDTLSPRLQSLLQNSLEAHRPARTGTQLISTSEQRLETMVREETFRPDLFFKVAVIPLSVPPLRERRSDIAPLSNFFLQELHTTIKGGPSKLSPTALKLLQEYPWPGNVSELKNSIQRAFALGGGELITEKELPPKLRDGSAALSLSKKPSEDGIKLPVGEPLGPFVKDLERRFIRATLEHTNGNKEQAASVLGISLATLYRKLDQ